MIRRPAAPAEEERQSCEIGKRAPNFSGPLSDGAPSED